MRHQMPLHFAENFQLWSRSMHGQTPHTHQYTKKGLCHLIWYLFDSFLEKEYLSLWGTGAKTDLPFLDSMPTIKFCKHNNVYKK